MGGVWCVVVCGGGGVVRGGGQGAVGGGGRLRGRGSYGGSIDGLPLPGSEPDLTERGVTFIYQPYEISYYAAGKPEFTIPSDAIRPYLTPQAVELFW